MNRKGENDEKTGDSTSELQRGLEIRTDGGTIRSKPVSEPQHDCHVMVDNLGGISNTERSIPPGISILVGRNATNRSSFLRSLAAGLGGNNAAASLKSDADGGGVKLSLGDGTFTREYALNGQTVTKDGSPYTDDTALVDTFVALFTDCPTRRAVELDDGLRDILMVPVDTEEIKSRIVDCKRERSKLDETIQQAESRKQNLPSLKEERTRLEDELEAVSEEIVSLESVVEDLNSPTDESSETANLRSELEALRSQLNSAERRADQIDGKLEFRRKERDELLQERDTVEENLDEFDDAHALETTVEELEAQISRLSDQRSTLQQSVEDLQSVIQANNTFLDGTIDVVGLPESNDVTTALDPESQTVECWTCGTEVEQGTITERLDTLRQVVAEHRTQITEIEDRLTELQREKASHEGELKEYEEATRRLNELDERIEQHAEKILELEAEYEAQQETVESLSDEIVSVEEDIENCEADAADESSAFIETHKELTRLERRRGRLENQLESTVEEIDAIEALEAEKKTAENRREQLTDELHELRGRIDQVERNLVETLNSIMEDLIDRLEYKNIARVWLERQTIDGDDKSSFELHIVRETDNGTVYEDTIDTLSESELEVIGLVVSLAGYLVHGVDETVPFLLIDSVENIDGPRLASLLDYIESKTAVEFLITALLPKDADAVASANVLDNYTVIDVESESI